MKKKAGILLITLAMLAGCSSAVPEEETEAQAQTEKFNVIQNHIDDSEYAQAFDEMFTDTLSAYNNRIEVDADSQGTYMQLKDAELESESANRQTDTVSFEQDGYLYIITETAQDTTTITRYGEDGGKSVTIDRKEDSSQGIVASIGGGTRENATNEERQTRLLQNIFSVSDSIKLNPVDNPEYYEFTNNDTGTGFVCSIDIKDFTKFNEENKSLFSGTYMLDGEPVVDINVKMDYFDITINNEGVISQVTNVIEIEYTQGGQTKEEKYSVTTSVYSYDYSRFNTTEISGIFDGIDDGSIQTGDTVALTVSSKQ